MKRFFSCLIVVLLLLSGCGSPEPRESRTVVVTIWPVYDWVCALLGDQAGDWDVTLLCDGSTDLHSYQPSVADIVKISTCDLFLCVGGESDAWVEDALQGAVNPDMQVLSLLELLGDQALQEEPLEGMQPEEAEEASDEHIWLSLRNAGYLCDKISQTIQALDPAHQGAYESSLHSYRNKLDTLDRDYQAVVDQSPCSTLLLADRYPFRYLCRDYGIQCYAAFSGCSAETEASFETVAFLAEKLSEQSLPAVLILETGDPALAQTIRDTAGSDAEILTIDSMQGNSAAYTGGYLGVMESDLSVLKTALGWEG